MTTDNKEELEREIENLEKQERRQQIKQDIQARLKDESIWMRLLHLVVFGFAFFIGMWVILFSVILHFILRVLTGETNRELQVFGKNIGEYFSQIINYASFNSDTPPFPFSEWPNDTRNT